MASRQERGTGSMLTLASVFVLLCVTAAACQIVGWFFAIRRGEQLAELSALAGAGAASIGAEPCGAARTAARENGSAVTECIIRGQGRDVVVEIAVAVDLSGTLGLIPQRIERRASAGTV